MYCLKLQSFPNEEIRAVVYRLPNPVNPLSHVETDETQPEAPLLDIGEIFESHLPAKEAEPKAGWGGLPRGRIFSRRGKRKLQRAGGVFTKLEYKPSQVLFLTGTLPGSTPEAFETMARYSGFLVHSLKAWLNDRIPHKLDFYVWEHQKRGALHLHYGIYCPDKAIGESYIASFPGYWCRLLKRRCGGVRCHSSPILCGPHRGPPPTQSADRFRSLPPGSASSPA